MSDSENLSPVEYELFTDAFEDLQSREPAADSWRVLSIRIHDQRGENTAPTQPRALHDDDVAALTAWLDKQRYTGAEAARGYDVNSALAELQ